MPIRTSRRSLTYFLRELARTGNLALAADRAGLAKSGIHKRKRRDAAFSQACETAIAAFRNHSPSPLMGEGRGEGDLSGAPALTTPGALVHSTYAGKPQLRRLPAGRLTDDGLAAFLAALASTGNIRLAAAHVGVAASSIHRRRRTDPAFARELTAALQLAAPTLECAIIEAADRTFDPGWMEGIGEDGPRISIEQAIRFLSGFQRRSGGR